MLSVTTEAKNIIEDAWLMKVLKRPVYKVIVNNELQDTKAKEAIERIQKNGGFIYSKIPTVDMARATILLDCGFRLVDTNIVLEKALEKDLELKSQATIRYADAKDQKQTAEVARSSFVYSRFHLDPGFSDQEANTIKALWVENYFKGERGAAMVVAEAENKIVGFNQLLQDKNVLTIDLIATDHAYQNKGIAKDMIVFAQNKSKDCTKLRVGTQIVNTPSLSLYERMGFKISQASHVFHWHGEKS